MGSLSLHDDEFEDDKAKISLVSLLSTGGLLLAALLVTNELLDEENCGEYENDELDEEEADTFAFVAAKLVSLFLLNECSDGDKSVLLVAALLALLLLLLLLVVFDFLRCLGPIISTINKIYIQKK